LTHLWDSHSEKLRIALEEITNEKEKEKVKAMETIRTEMQSLVDVAYAARDEYLALYTKVFVYETPLIGWSSWDTGK
jgi:phage-related protein